MGVETPVLRRLEEQGLDGVGCGACGAERRTLHVYVRSSRSRSRRRNRYLCKQKSPTSRARETRHASLRWISACPTTPARGATSSTPAGSRSVFRCQMLYLFTRWYCIHLLVTPGYCWCRMIESVDVVRNPPSPTREPRLTD